MKKNNEKSQIASSIIQLHGEGDMDSEDANFTFNSEYGEEDIVNSLTEILPKNLSHRATLVSIIVVRPFNRAFSADHKCTVLLAAVDQTFLGL